MRQIGTISDEEGAARFGAHLATLGIDNTVEPSGEGWAVWVENDDHLDQARAELEGFHAVPNDPKYGAAVQAAKVLQAEQDRAEQRRRANFVDVRTRAGQPNQWNAPLTIGLIVISCVAFVLTHGWMQQDRPIEGVGPENTLRIASIAVSGDWVTWDGLGEAEHGQVWRLITPIFLHYGILHIVFNMFWLRDLGAMIETRRSTLFLAVLVLGAAIASNLAQYFWQTAYVGRAPNFGGMSGVVYALFGYIWIRGRVNPAGGIGINPQTAMVMMIWLVACMVGIIPNVANAAHVAGLGVGVVFAYVPHLARKWGRR